MVKAAFFNQAAEGGNIDYVYADGRIDQVAELTELHPTRITTENFEAEVENLQDVEVIFSTWGMLALTAEQIDKLPNLKAVFYGAGSVKGFARPFLEKGITVCSAVSANAIPVAEFCLGQILLASKRYYTNTQSCRKEGWGNDRNGKGVYGETVALIGVGEITRKLLELLKPFHLRIIAVSNHLSQHPEKAKALGIDEIVSLEEAFQQAYIVSNHLPNLESNKKIMNESHFASMREGATFINTGRGAQVDEEALVKVMKERADLTALLDVTHPEPPESGSELYSQPNIHLSSHIAGSMNDEVIRMADYMIEEFKRWQAGDELQHSVYLEMLDKMA
ncbi:MAG: hydroxyacid dehydrogenase [Planctomycetota bacterium]|jgi:phosphoglycerate dehydrogenase-like enzyme